MNVLQQVALTLDRIARNLDKKGLGPTAGVLCGLRDVVAARAGGSPSLTRQAAKLDALARRASELGMDDVAAELCEVRDSVDATALDGPDGFKPVNTGEEGYPDESAEEPVNMGEEGA